MSSQNSIKIVLTKDENTSGMRLSEVLKKVRRDAGVSQAVLGGRVGWDSPRVSELESGRRDMGIKTLSRYLRGLGPGISAELVIRREDGPDSEQVYRVRL